MMWITATQGQSGVSTTEETDVRMQKTTWRLISLLVEKGCAACGKFISKLAERDLNLYRTLGLRHDISGWSLFDRIPEFIKSDAVLEGLLKDMQEMKLLSDGEVEEVKKQASTWDRTSQLRSMVMRKGDAISENFLSKLAERDPEFYSTHGPDLDPVDRLMQVQSQFAERVSDAVMEGLLKDMLEMKVLSDEDVDEVRDAPQNTGLQSWLVEQINSGRYPGLTWTNEALKQFRIPWKHDDRKDLTPEDTIIFKDWAVVTGRYREGIDQPDPAYWRRHFQRALDKDESLVLRADHSRDPVDPHKIYWSEDMLADKRMKVKLEKACCLISLLVEKGRAACGKFISKLAERDPEFYSTHGPVLDPVDRLMQVQPQFVKRVSDAVMEGLLKDMLEMKVLSNEDVEEVRDAPQNTGLGSWLVEQINSGRYPGLSWTNEALKQFRIPWKHDNRKDLTSEDTMIFKDWAVVTGRYREGIDQPDPADWRRHFQRALEDKSLVLRADHSRDPVDPHKIYWISSSFSFEKRSLALRKSYSLEHLTQRLSLEDFPELQTRSRNRQKVRSDQVEALKRRLYTQEMSPECKTEKGNCDPVSEKSQGDHSMCEAAKNEVSELTTFRPTVHHEGHHKYYRFSFEKEGAYQCEITALIFDMASPAEVVYGTEQWEKCPLDQSSLLPAGPLYDINSPSRALEHLSFPHSECSPEVQNHLMVAHYKNGNVELIKPTEVTETHVKIKVNETSLFGLVRRVLKNWLDYKSKAQVLLFLRQLAKKKKLNVFLLSSNVVLDDVQEKQKHSIFIETSSHCVVLEEEKYSVSCDQENAIVQPATYDFVRDYGPNFPPTFEIFLNSDVEELSLEVFESTRRDASVWTRRVLLDGAHSPVGPPRPAPPENNTLVNECGWKQALFDIIEELTGREYKKMKVLLNKEIPLGKLEETDRESMAHLIISQCGLQRSIQVTQELMRQIPRNDERIQSLLKPFLEQTG